MYFSCYCSGLALTLLFILRKRSVFLFLFFILFFKILKLIFGLFLCTRYKCQHQAFPSILTTLYLFAIAHNVSIFFVAQFCSWYQKFPSYFIIWKIPINVTIPDGTCTWNKKAFIVFFYPITLEILNGSWVDHKTTID